MSVIKPISGSFLEIEHPNRAERVRTHEPLCAFTETMWRAKVRELHELGIDTLVLLSTALRGQAYFPLEGFSCPDHIACQTVIEVLLDEADKTGQSMYIGVGFYGDSDSVNNSTDPAIVATAMTAMETLWGLYGHHPSFVGWYIADEWCLWEHFDERFITYINTVCAKAKALSPTANVIVAPFGTHCMHIDDVLAEQLERIDAYAIAYQDEIGVKKMSLDRLAARYEALQTAHAKAGRAKLWVDTEIFTFEGDVYRSALLPASFERIKAQLEAVSPYVEKVIAYTCQGMMSKPDSLAPLGGEQAERLYREYREWAKNL